MDEKEFLKADKGTEKEFLKAERMIYKMISSNPWITIPEMALNIGVSDRQVRKYLKRMTDMKFIVREGGRKNGMWRIIDGDYEDFFERTWWHLKDMDKLTKEQRHRCMSVIKGRNTKPELLVHLDWWRKITSLFSEQRPENCYFDNSHAMIQKMRWKAVCFIKQINGFNPRVRQVPVDFFCGDFVVSIVAPV